MRLIDADELKKDDETTLILSSNAIRTGKQLKLCAEMFIAKIDKAPTIDAVPVVRCKNCKHWKDSDGIYRRGVGAESKCPINTREVFEGDFYCAYGEEENE